MNARIRPDIRVQDADFDLGEEVRRLVAGRSDIGAVVTFTGICRDEQGKIGGVDLEHYPAMAEREIGRVAHEACARWALSGLSVIHRFGRIGVGENIVMVAAASAHRQAAFEAAAFIMDYLKARAPFWKKEHPRSGKEGSWVGARDADAEAVRRWQDGKPMS